MDHDAMLAQPLEVVFGHLAAPSRLADWLPEVTAVQAGGIQPGGIGVTFRLNLHRAGQDADADATGELIAYEPPWCVAYRITAGSHTYVLRVTCVAAGGATRVHVHQTDGNAPLAVDLVRLPEHLLVPAAGQEAAPGPGGADPGLPSRPSPA